MEIYREFLKYYGYTSKTSLNIAQTTVELDTKAKSRAECFTGFQAENLVNQTLHIFSADAFKDFKAHVVDEKTHSIDFDKGGGPDAELAAALFTFSEIVFDANHTHAVVSFTLECTMLCSQGGTIVFERKNGKWVQKGYCSGWYM